MALLLDGHISVKHTLRRIGAKIFSDKNPKLLHFPILTTAVSHFSCRHRCIAQSLNFNIITSRFDIGYTFRPPKLNFLSRPQISTYASTEIKSSLGSPSSSYRLLLFSAPISRTPPCFSPPLPQNPRHTREKTGQE